MRLIPFGFILLATAALAADRPGAVKILVPAAANLTVDGTRTTLGGEERRFNTPPLREGVPYSYKVKATWLDAGRLIVREQTIPVAAGQETEVDLRADATTTSMTALPVEPEKLTLLAPDAPVVKPEVKPEPKPEPALLLPIKPTEKPEPKKPEPKPEVKPEVKPEAKLASKKPMPDRLPEPKPPAGAVRTFAVSGKVVVDGAPAAGAVVILHPKADALRALRPSATVKEDGSFRVGTYSAADGAPAGEYTVTVTWPQRRGDDDDERVDRLAGRYGSATKSGLTLTVKEGTNELPLELKSK